MALFSITVNYLEMATGKRAVFNCLRGQFSDYPKPFTREDAEAQADRVMRDIKYGKNNLPRAKKGTAITYQIQKIQ